ncbi:MAG: prepilin-type N-terminal cleavage/methylation domain-containing protein [Gammaproteobacteria bacterium]|nr:prepilin-type N-terminal cleavage/methylation domain-containing protein [Gammaproteobacteria bacterium]MDH3413139.1 prepilin-type N-terminal cleavage/methylation domain-containing protein [Gammaproteobacteria bacterium]
MIDVPFSAGKVAPRRKSGAGFTLIELVVVLAVVGLLLGVIMTPLATQFRVRTIKAAERNLSDVKEALIGYAMTNRRLPCPDTDSTPDGQENPLGGGTCTALEGFLPWNTLGVDASDVWGRLYIYRVSPEFTHPTVPGTPPAASQLDLNDSGNINIVDRASDKSEITLTTTAAVVIVSLGGNGYGGRDTDGNSLVAPTGADELENTDSDVKFVRRNYSIGAATCSDTAGTTSFCEYDDLVTWIPEPLLKSHLVEAGRLP